ncbi:MAG: hypothetical protein Greene071421_579 [Parcubacteria group bacterium Greene0714_21]|nr:MAG: hypothetical protein Greene041639_491 [Parcubacteria group bacterium Greene0416_39]TSD03845.1 MAG: hypothetical protein Greene071421_579 [Parcubacteria group bacterium Greene0714_21]
MNQLVVTKTREYLILKIPLSSIKSGASSIAQEEREAVFEGLRAVKAGRVSPSFQSAKSAIAFLRTL